MNIGFNGELVPHTGARAANVTGQRVDPSMIADIAKAQPQWGSLWKDVAQFGQQIFHMSEQMQEADFRVDALKAQEDFQHQMSSLSQDMTARQLNGEFDSPTEYFNAYEKGLTQIRQNVTNAAYGTADGAVKGYFRNKDINKERFGRMVESMQEASWRQGVAQYERDSIQYRNNQLDASYKMGEAVGGERGVQIISETVASDWRVPQEQKAQTTALLSNAIIVSDAERSFSTLVINARNNEGIFNSLYTGDTQALGAAKAAFVKSIDEETARRAAAIAENAKVLGLSDEEQASYIEKQFAALETMADNAKKGYASVVGARREEVNQVSRDQIAAVNANEPYNGAPTATTRRYIAARDTQNKTAAQKVLINAGIPVSEDELTSEAKAYKELHDKTQAVLQEKQAKDKELASLTKRQTNRIKYGLPVKADELTPEAKEFYELTEELNAIKKEADEKKAKEADEKAKEAEKTAEQIKLDEGGVAVPEAEQTEDFKTYLAKKNRMKEIEDRIANEQARQNDAIFDELYGLRDGDGFDEKVGELVGVADAEVAIGQASSAANIIDGLELTEEGMAGRTDSEITSAFHQAEGWAAKSKLEITQARAAIAARREELLSRVNVAWGGAGKNQEKKGALSAAIIKASADANERLDKAEAEIDSRLVAIGLADTSARSSAAVGPPVSGQGGTESAVTPSGLRKQAEVAGGTALAALSAAPSLVNPWSSSKVPGFEHIYNEGDTQATCARKTELLLGFLVRAVPNEASNRSERLTTLSAIAHRTLDGAALKRVDNLIKARFAKTNSGMTEKEKAPLYSAAKATAFRSLQQVGIVEIEDPDDPEEVEKFFKTEEGIAVAGALEYVNRQIDNAASYEDAKLAIDSLNEILPSAIAKGRRASIIGSGFGYDWLTDILSGSGVPSIEDAEMTTAVEDETSRRTAVSTALLRLGFPSDAIDSVLDTKNGAHKELAEKITSAYWGATPTERASGGWFTSLREEIEDGILWPAKGVVQGAN